MTTCSDKKSPPEISDKLCKPPGFLFAALKNYLLSEKAPLKNEAIKNAPRKTKLQNKCPPEICTARPHVQSAQKQPYLTSQFRGALLTQSVTLEFSQDTGCEGCNCWEFKEIKYDISQKSNPIQVGPTKPIQPEL